MESRTNILFITVDQLRWDFYSNQTVKVLKTPHLDRLRSEGMCLTHTYSNSPVCAATRMTWTHGLYGSQVSRGVLENWQDWPTDLRSMPNALKKNGYRTALIGKLHAHGGWGNDLSEDRFKKDGQKRGYDEILEVCGKSFAYNVDCHWTHHLRKIGKYDAYMKDLERRLEQLGADEPSDAGILEVEDSADTFIGNHVCSWLEDYDQKDPFFLHASYCGPHFPIDPPKAYHQRYKPEEMPDPIGLGPHDDVAYWKRRMAAYCAMIEHLDDEVGKVLQVLDQRELAENTLVLFMTDHGDMMAHKGMAHKTQPEDTSMRTPVIARLPGVIAPGSQSNAMIECVDVPCTFIDVAGGDVDDELLDTPGKSFLPLLTGDAREHRDWIYSESGLSGNWRCIRDLEWKYVFYPEGKGPDRLYHMTEDPWELENKINDASCAEVMHKMQRRLLECMIRCVAPRAHKIGQNP